MKTIIARSVIALTMTALMTAPSSATIKGPAAGGYTATDEVVVSFIDLAVGGGTSLLAGVDDGMAPIALPFAVPFYSASYSMACVSVNGALYFVTSPLECSAFVDFANTDLNATPPAALPALLPFWSDLTFETQGAGSVLYGLVDGQGARRFIIQWQHAMPSGASSPVTFQIVFTEGTGKILYQYKTVDLGAGLPASRAGQATIGIRNADVMQSLEWSVNVPVIADGTAILFSSGNDDTTAPVLTLPGTLTREATGPTTPVTYTATAIDDVDGSVTPECTPSSGAPFPVGTTVVTCTATDANANGASASFNVEITDLTPPAITVPANITVTATSAAGAAVTFNASATDLVSGPVAVLCSPASGHTFPIGVNAVSCSATDGLGNTGARGFTVTVNADDDDPTPGLMIGNGEIRQGNTRHEFEFLIRERASGSERGSLKYENTIERRGRDEQNKFRSRTITSVEFSNLPNVSPGRPRGSRVDTVMFKGTGDWNGKRDHTFEVKATDAGEPGRDRDRFSLTIRNRSGQVVLSVTGELDRGNIQALPIPRWR